MANNATDQKKNIAVKTAAQALAAVRQNGDVLEYIPDTFKTAELCMAAVRNYSNNVQKRLAVTSIL